MYESIFGPLMDQVHIAADLAPYGCICLHYMQRFRSGSVDTSVKVWTKVTIGGSRRKQNDVLTFMLSHDLRDLGTGNHT